MWLVNVVGGEMWLRLVKYGWGNMVLSEGKAILQVFASCSGVRNQEAIHIHKCPITELKMKLKPRLCHIRGPSHERNTRSTTWSLDLNYIWWPIQCT